MPPKKLTADANKHGATTNEINGKIEEMEKQSSRPVTHKDNSSSPTTSSPSDLRTGRVKWYNVLRGFGFIIPSDGGEEVFVHQTAIIRPGFRSLGDDEIVEFKSRIREDDGSGRVKYEATFVSGPNGADCIGNSRRPLSKRKNKKIRCYNCGQFASHLAINCPMGKLDKCCYHCQSPDHLIGNCPVKAKANNIENNNNSGTPGAIPHQSNLEDSNTNHDGSTPPSLQQPTINGTDLPSN